MLPCYHAKTRNVFLCLSIDSHLEWTTPVVMLPVVVSKSGRWSPRQVTHFQCRLVGYFTSPGIDTR